MDARGQRELVGVRTGQRDDVLVGQQLADEAPAVDRSRQPVRGEHHVHPEQSRSGRDGLTPREVLVSVLASRGAHGRDRTGDEPARIVARHTQLLRETVRVREADPLREQEEVRIVAGDLHDVSAEACVRRTHRVHRPARALDQTHEPRHREARLPCVAHRGRLLRSDVGAADEPIRSGLDGRSCSGAERGDDALDHPRRDVRESLGGQERREPCDVGRRDLLVEHRLERRTVTRVDAAATDEPDALPLDQVGQRSGAALAGSAVVRPDLGHAEAGPAVGVVDAEHLADELLVPQQGRVRLRTRAAASRHGRPLRGRRPWMRCSVVLGQANAAIPVHTVLPPCLGTSEVGHSSASHPSGLPMGPRKDQLPCRW